MAGNVRIVSINLNQRSGSRQAAERLEAWLLNWRPDVVLAQEPWRRDAEPVVLKGYNLVGHSQVIAAWVRHGLSASQIVQHAERWQELDVGGVTFHHVYLSPDSSKERRLLLLDLAGAVRDSGKHLVVAGDFNLAPTPEDGFFGGRISQWTKASERTALQKVLTDGNLVDTTSAQSSGRQEFTFERRQSGKALRFRCDLALVSIDIKGVAQTRYDHSVRLGPGSFTDHSAIVVDLAEASHPLSRRDDLANRPGKRLVSRPKPDPRESALAAASPKTAIRRREASQIARKLIKQGLLQELGVHSILDYGCGWGKDVEFYRSQGFDADGYDPESKFGFNELPERSYDIVCLVFVINVLPNVEDRLDAVSAAAKCVRPGGSLLIAARSPRAVESEARKGAWDRVGDGYVSSGAKGTFQKGISEAEIAWLLGASGLTLQDCRLGLSAEVSFALGRSVRLR